MQIMHARFGHICLGL